MTNNEFKNLVINNNGQDEYILLNNGLTLVVSLTEKKPIWVTLSLYFNDSVAQVTHVRKSAYRKVMRFCRQNHIKASASFEWDNHFIRMIIHSKKDWNRLGNLFQFLNGKKLAKTVRNNNPYCV